MQIHAPERVDELIAQSFEDMQYRPTVLAIATHECEDTIDPELLVVRSANERWPLFWPAQGGINPGEDVGAAASRELFEETEIGVPPDFTKVLGAAEYDKGESKDGFTKGNLLVGVHLKFGETAWRRVRLELDEVQGAMMLPPEQWIWGTESLLEQKESDHRQWGKLYISTKMIELALGRRVL